MNLKQIATELGLSVSTVSRVFSNHPKISEEVRGRVLALARKHHYHPRLAPKQRNVVVLMPYNASYPVPCCVEMLLLAMTRELPSHGFRLEILPMDNQERLSQIQFCGAVALGAEPAAFHGWGQRFLQPLVLVDRFMPAPERGVHTVRSDEAAGMALAIDALHAAGRRHIGCIVHGHCGVGNADVRAEGIRKALRTHALSASDAFIRLCDDHEYLEQIGQLLALGIDGLFCPGGAGGILAAHALALFNRRIPQDISLVASELHYFSAYGTPPQTTITQDYPAVAQATARLLETAVTSPLPPQDIVLPYLLLNRQSVTPV